MLSTQADARAACLPARDRCQRDRHQRRRQGHRLRLPSVPANLLVTDPIQKDNIVDTNGVDDVYSTTSGSPRPIITLVSQHNGVAGTQGASNHPCSPPPASGSPSRARPPTSPASRWASVSSPLCLGADRQRPVRRRHDRREVRRLRTLTGRCHRRVARRAARRGADRVHGGFGWRVHRPQRGRSPRSNQIYVPSIRRELPLADAVGADDERPAERRRGR